MVTVSSKTDLLEVEIDDPRNRCLFFLPLQRRIRGRFDYGRVAEPLAKMKTNEWPLPIPGQRLAVDIDAGEAHLIESLRDEGNALLKEKIEKSARIPQNERFQNIDMPTWLYWIKRAVDAGIARVVRGELPEHVDGEPQKSFFSKPAENPNTRLAAAIEKQTEVMAKLIEMLAARK